MRGFQRTAFVVAALLTVGGSLYAEKHAVLIGVSDYPNQPKESWLKGPENDVTLIRELLLTPACGFNATNIVSLSGWPTNATQRPTFTNIKTTIETMAKTVADGDFVFLLFSGHGSQQPSKPNPDDIETDGLDEIFLPADAGAWDEKAGVVENAIADDQVRLWVNALLSRGASVWVIFDSCHSGTMTRDFATDDRQYRRIAPEALVPESALREAAQRRSQSRAVGTTDSPHEMTTARPGLIAMYAAQSFEPTFEIPLPNADDNRHGIFTYMLASILASAESPMTYRELSDRITTLYRCNGVMQPTPVIEGTALDALVMQSNNLGQRPAILMFTEPLRGRLKIDRGSLHGIGRFSLLEVFPPAGAPNADKAVGFVKVSRVQALTAEVVPVLHAGMPALSRDALGLGMRCRIASVAFDLPPLRVAAREAKPVLAPLITFRAAPASRPEWESIVAAVAADNPTLVTNVSLANADWIVTSDRGMAVIDPATRSVAAGHSAGVANRILIADLSQPASRDDQSLTRKTQSALLRLARARQLLNLAATGASGDAPSGVQVSVELIRYVNEIAQKGDIVKRGGTGRVLHDGDIVSFRITNPNDVPIDVSLLFLDSQYGITCLFPEKGTVDDNRLMPGQVIEIPRIAVTASTTGPEQVVAIAVRSTQDRQDFSCLEQESLGQMRGNGGLDASPLGKLIQTTVYGKGKTRGLNRGALSEYRVTTLPWTTVP